MGLAGQLGPRPASWVRGKEEEEVELWARRTEASLEGEVPRLAGSPPAGYGMGRLSPDSLG